MSEEIKEIKSPLDLVTITVVEYKALCKAEARLEMMQELNAKNDEIAKINEEMEQYKRWWHNGSNENDKLKEELEQTHQNLDEAKNQIEMLLGVQELKKVSEVQDA